MGGGPLDHEKEQMLVILPFAEPRAAFERIEKKHPNIEITYKELLFTDTPGKAKQEAPEGEPLTPLALPPLQRAFEAQEPPTSNANLSTAEIFKNVTILVTLSALPLHPHESSPHLEFIHFISAGTNHIANTPVYTDTSIPLTTSSGIHGPQIAEWVIMTMLCSSHRFSILHDWQRDHNWGKGANSKLLGSLRDKSGQRLGVLGYGSIGRQAARVAKAMGMDVLAYTASPRTTPESKHDNGFIVPGTGDPDGSIPSAWYSGLDKASLHNFLQQDLDHLLISVPLTKETRHFIAAEEFAILGKTKNAFISNISRGPIIKQHDLITYLRKFDNNDPLNGGDGGGGLRGAALDVTDPEPLPAENELWDAPNCIITPHISGLGDMYMERALSVLEVNLERRERGERMINVVDRKRGY